MFRNLMMMTVFGLFSAGSVKAASDPYQFVKGFELVNVAVNGTTATVTVEHKKTYSTPRFELIPGQACLESYPAQCYGTVVRLDDSGYTEEVVQTTFQVNLKTLYGYDKGVFVSVYGPNSRRINIRY